MTRSPWLLMTRTSPAYVVALVFVDHSIFYADSNAVTEEFTTDNEWVPAWVRVPARVRRQPPPPSSKSIDSRVISQYINGSSIRVQDITPSTSNTHDKPGLRIPVSANTEN